MIGCSLSLGIIFFGHGTAGKIPGIGTVLAARMDIGRNDKIVGQIHQVDIRIAANQVLKQCQVLSNMRKLHMLPPANSIGFSDFAPCV